LKRFALILLVAGILAVLAFLALRSNDSGTHVVAPEAGEKSVAPSSESAVAPEPTPAPTDKNERTSVAPLTQPGDAERASGWTVCVVDESTNAPIGGARVSVSDSQAIGRATIAQGIGADTFEGLRRRRELAVELETGPDGCAHFATPPTSAWVEARHGELWGVAQVNQPPADGRVTLPIGPDRELRVRVVDAAGTPVGGVPVALRRQTDARPAFTWKWTDTATQNGVATFLHFQRRLAQGTGWHAMLAFPVREQHALPVDALTPSEPPLELVLPGTGSVLVRVRAADGSVPELGDAELRIEAFESESRSTPLWPGGPWSTPRLDAGETRVPWIGVGLFVRATLVREEAVLAAKSIAGPTRAGEEVVCELDWLERAPCFVTGRFVLRDGRAWPAATVVAQPLIFPGPARWPQSRALDVGARGRFRMQVDDVRPQNGSLKFRFTAPHPDGLGEVNALLALDQEIPSEGLELGDVLLDHGVLLAAGRVVDAERRPIAGATLEVRARTLVQAQELWPRIPTSGTVRTGDDGGFAVYLPSGESAPGDELRLRAAAKDCAAERDVDVRLGERGVELVLARAGALAGSLLLERGVAPGDFVLVVVGAASRLGANTSSDGSFEVRELLPGTYSLEVKRVLATAAERASAAVVEDLVVRAGETCRDPRIQGLRIESALRTLRIRVVDHASSPLARAAVSIVGGTAARTVLSGNDGVAFVRFEALPVDLEVAAFGFARRRLAGVSSDREVVLDAGFPIRLRTSARTSGGAPRYVLYVLLSSVGVGDVPARPAWGPELDLASYRFDERGEFALRMPEAGLYECEVHVTVLRDDRVGAGALVNVTPRPRIDVRALDEEQVFELAIPQAAIDEAVEEVLR
jgi:hypothetical protein